MGATGLKAKICATAIEVFSMTITPHTTPFPAETLSSSLSEMRRQGQHKGKMWL